MDRKILLSPYIRPYFYFVAGLLHLLVISLVKPSTRDPDEFDNVTALQGQLQQLFTLHDSGVDQSFIDTLPVFTYKSIISVKNPFDCAMCLCEFEGDDQLRLLPKRSHAFHIDCIDTWLLSHGSAISECGGDSRRDFKGFEGYSGRIITKESFSVSKLWLRGKKEKPDSTISAAIEPPSTTTFSLQFLLRQTVAREEAKVSEMGCDDQEVQSCHSIDLPASVPNPPSFTKRSLLWLMGRQKNKGKLMVAGISPENMTGESPEMSNSLETG